MEVKVAFLFIVGCAAVLAAPQFNNRYWSDLQGLAAQNANNVQDLYSNVQQLPQNLQGYAAQNSNNVQDLISSVVGQGANNAQDFISNMQRLPQNLQGFVNQGSNNVQDLISNVQRLPQNLQGLVGQGTNNVQDFLQRLPQNLQGLVGQGSNNVQDIISNLQRLPQNVQNSLPSLPGGNNQLPSGNFQPFNPNYWQQAGSQQFDNLNNLLLPQTANVNRPPWNNSNNFGLPQTSNNNWNPWNFASQFLPQTANTNNFPWGLNTNNGNNNNGYRTPLLRVPNQVIDQVQHTVDDALSRVGGALDKTWDSTQRMAENTLTNLQKLGSKGIEDGIGVAKGGLDLVSTVPKMALGMFTDRENNNKS